MDWRFLLPSFRGGRPDTLVLRGGDAAARASVEESGAAGRVVDAWPPDHPADAIVLLHGARETVEDAAPHLTDDGVVYFEVARPRRDALVTATPDLVRDRIRAAGLEPAGCWAVWPDFADYEFFVPAGSETAVRWFIEVELPASTPRERAVRQGLKAAARAVTGQRLLFTGRFACIAARGRAAPPAILAAAPIVAQAREARHIALATHGADRAVAICFDGGDSPALVVKIARTVEGVAKTRDEQSALEGLRAAASESIIATLPRPLGVADACGTTIGLESYVPGRALVHMAAATPERKRKALSAAIDFIAQVHEATARPGAREWDQEAVRRWIDPAVAAYRDAVAPSGDEERLLDAMSERARALVGRILPTVTRHGDFTPWNLRFNGAALSVIDWEGAGPGPALMDPLHLLTHWLELANGAATAADRLALFGAGIARGRFPGRAGASADAALDRYCARVGADRVFMPLMLSLVWVDLTARSAARAGGGVATLDHAYVRVLAASVDALFVTSR